jgi:hypothetical protein
VLAVARELGIVPPHRAFEAASGHHAARTLHLPEQTAVGLIGLRTR